MPGLRLNGALVHAACLPAFHLQPESDLFSMCLLRMTDLQHEAGMEFSSCSTYANDKNILHFGVTDTGYIQSQTWELAHLKNMCFLADKLGR